MFSWNCGERIQRGIQNLFIEIGYVFFTDFPAYAGEYAEPDEYETRKDFERRENLPSLGDDTAIRIFQEVEWTCSDTLYNELQYSE